MSHHTGPTAPPPAGLLSAMTPDERAAHIAECERQSAYASECAARHPQPEWWEDPTEVRRVEAMLLHARSYGPSHVQQENVLYYRSKPWKWSAARSMADHLEQIMVNAGIDTTEGWYMTASEILRAAEERDSKRGKGMGR